MIIALPIEIKTREYIPKLNLAYNIIKNTNHDVIIGKKAEIYSLFKKSKNLFLISKGGPKKKFKFSNVSLNNNIFSILDEEGPLINLNKIDFKNRCSYEVLKKCDYYFSWGKLDKRLLLDKVNIKGKILNFGHPKFDINDNKNFFNRQKKFLKKKFKKFVFFPSNFHQDQIMDSNDYLLWRSKQSENEKIFITKSKKILLKDHVNYLKTINFLKKLAALNPKINFIFRPHPRQDIKKVKRRFKNIQKNIFICNKFSISPYIHSCNFFLHRGCTSVFEALKFKKKIIYLKKYNYNHKTFMDKINGYIINKPEKDVFLVSKIIKGQLNLPSVEKLDIIENIGKKKFYLKFNKFINNKKFNNIETLLNLEIPLKKNIIINYVSILKNYLIKYNFVKKFLLKFKPDLILSTSYINSKFDSLKKNEIISDLNKTLNVKKHYMKIKKIHFNTFLMTRKN